MKRNISTLLAPCSLIAFVAAQSEVPTEFTSIRKGATEYNNPGYWQDGIYSTIVSADGENDLEVRLTLHNPAQKEGNTYLQWI